MDKSLLDTDIFSEVLKGIDAHVVGRARTYEAALSRLTVSTITVMEIVKGFYRLGHEHRIQQFLTELATAEVLAFDQASAETAGRIYADLERAGQPIGFADTMIAGMALQHNLVLVTGNLGHYLRIQALGYGLKLDNWRV